MRRIIVSFLVGVVLATTGSVYAEDMKSLVGLTKKIQAEVSVKVDGKKADKAGIIIDGTTYLPIRSIGSALNMDVSYSKTEVELTSKGESKVESTPETAPEPKQMSQDDVDAIKSSEEQIEIAKKRITERKLKLPEYESELKVEEEKLANVTDALYKPAYQFNVDNLKNMIESAKESIQMDEKIISDLQSYIAKIKAKYE